MLTVGMDGKATIVCVRINPSIHHHQLMVSKTHFHPPIYGHISCLLCSERGGWKKYHVEPPAMIQLMRAKWINPDKFLCYIYPLTAHILISIFEVHSIEATALLQWHWHKCATVALRFLRKNQKASKKYIVARVIAQCIFSYYTHIAWCCCCWL